MFDNNNPGTLNALEFKNSIAELSFLSACQKYGNPNPLENVPTEDLLKELERRGYLRGPNLNNLSIGGTNF